MSKLVATAEYEDGTTADVTKEVSIDAAAFDSAKEGTYEIELSYGDGAFTKSFEVVVAAKSSVSDGTQDKDPDQNTDEENNTNKENNTDTGVADMAGLAALLGLYACGILVVFTRKRFVK